MKTISQLTLTPSPLSQPAGKPRKTANLALRPRSLYGRKRHYHTVKERDSETGLYYYGARYLDSKTSRWLSGDPAMGEYVPSAPVDDEAKKRNGSLPGMGGVFNYVNLHVYHYAGNNPVRYSDPDGMEVDAVFVITSYEKTADGVTAHGKLTITDRDTGESITTDAYSGGIGQAEDGVSLPLPLGEYSILDQAKNPDFYRLEPEDNNFGNDIADDLSPKQENIRLHGPGSGLTYGCLAVKNRSDYRQIDSMLKKTKTSTAETLNKSRNPFNRNSTETVTKYGSLTVVNRVPYPGMLTYRHPSLKR